MRCKPISFRTNIIEDAIRNEKQGPLFLYENPNGHVQVAVMAVKKRVEMESHKKLTQLVHIVQGKGIIQIGNIKRSLVPGILVIIPYNTEHEITNTGENLLKLYTVYTKDLKDSFDH